MEIRYPKKERAGLAWRCLTAGIMALLFGVRCSAQQTLNDPSFHPGAGADNPVDAIVTLPDQRILVGGEFTTFNTVSNAYLLRLYPDGSIDESFSSQGLTDGPIYRMETQADGAVLVAGAFEQLLGIPRRRLARLSSDGTVDLSFDASDSFETNDLIYAVAVQPDGKILVAATTPGPPQVTSRILCLQTNGSPDPDFSFANTIDGFVHLLLPQKDGSILVGGGILLEGYPGTWGLFRLKSTGEVDPTFDAGLGPYSTVFSAARKPDGKIVIGGSLYLFGSTKATPLAQLDTNLQWDITFRSDFDGLSDADITTVLLQPDGKLVAGGSFFEVGGYWRRQLLRLDTAGNVDPCFDPGLGLGGNAQGAVRTLSLADGGNILAGGEFYGCDLARQDQNHIARLLPQNDCDQVRVYLNATEAGFVAATFPPGKTNILEVTENLQDWQPLEAITYPYIFQVHRPERPQEFFRARQQR